MYRRIFSVQEQKSRVVENKLPEECCLKVGKHWRVQATAEE